MLVEPVARFAAIRWMSRIIRPFDDWSGAASLCLAPDLTGVHR
jgi:hypothetical protein